MPEEAIVVEGDDELLKVLGVGDEGEGEEEGEEEEEGGPDDADPEEASTGAVGAVQGGRVCSTSWQAKHFIEASSCGSSPLLSPPSGSLSLFAMPAHNAFELPAAGIAYSALLAWPISVLC